MLRPFTLSDDAINLIYQHHKSDKVRIKEANLRSSSIILPVDVLRNILEGAFWASLEEEEAKKHLFTLEIESSFWDMGIMPQRGYLFDKNIDYSYLSKLAPALEKNTNYKIGVWYDKENKPYIWGFSELNLDKFNITAIASGKLVISYKFLPSILLEKERVRVLKQKDIFFDILFSRQTIDSEQSEEKRIQTEKRLHFVSYVLIEIAILMMEHGHGGCLLFVKKDSEWKNSISLPIVYASNSFLPYSGAAFKLKSAMDIFNDEPLPQWSEIYPEEERKKVFSQEAARHQLEDAVNLISRLTAVDGATVITNSFSVSGFGAKIKPINSEDVPKKVIIEEPFENYEDIEKELAFLGGTRHQSAAQFVYDQKDSIAIVASQDGKLSVMYWDKEIEKVRVIQHAEYLFM